VDGEMVERFESGHCQIIFCDDLFFQARVKRVDIVTQRDRLYTLSCEEGVAFYNINTMHTDIPLEMEQNQPRQQLGKWKHDLCDCFCPGGVEQCLSTYMSFLLINI
jgi:hypothetical protein